MKYINLHVRKPSRHHLRRLLAALLSLFSISAARAQDVWTGDGGNTLFSTSGNWSGGVPSTGSTVDFGSAFTGASIYSSVSLASINYVSGAENYSTLGVDEGTTLTLTDSGFTNTSGNLQYIQTYGGSTGNAGPVPTQGSAIVLDNSATLPSNSDVFVMGGNGSGTASTLSFYESSSAGSSTTEIDNYTPDLGGTDSGGATYFYDSSSAASSVIENGNGYSTGTGAGSTTFTDSATAANSSIANEGGYSYSYNGNTYVFQAAGKTYFDGNSTAGSATIENGGGYGSIMQGGETIFTNTSTAANAVITNYAGGNGGVSGAVYFEGTASGGAATIFNYGTFDISGDTAVGGVSVGSISGSGTFYLGGKTLTVGSLNTSMTVGGSILDSGVSGGSGAGLIKVGTGTLTLTGNNTYTGGTTVTGGGLLADSGDSTGSGAVTVGTGGTLGGTGTITPSGAGAGPAISVAAGGTLSPSAGTGIASLLTLALQSNQSLDLLSGAKLAFALGSPGSGFSDQIDITGGELVLSGQNFSAFTFTTLAGFSGSGTYDLLATSSSGDITGSLGTETGTVDGYSANLTVVNSQYLELTVNAGAVPEPSTWALVFTTASGLVATQGRLRKRLGIKPCRIRML